ncbi:MAG: CU044_2847 family protein [Candidatus Nanopelagicales bacterium]
MQLVEFPLHDGGHVVVGIEQVEGEWSGVVTRGGGLEERMHEAVCTFEEALEPIRVVGQGVLNRLAALDRPPEEVRVEFGLELSAKAGAIVSASGAATMKVVLTWRAPAPPTAPPPVGAAGPQAVGGSPHDAGR